MGWGWTAAWAAGLGFSAELVCTFVKFSGVSLRVMPFLAMAVLISVAVWMRAILSASRVNDPSCTLLLLAPGIALFCCPMLWSTLDVGSILHLATDWRQIDRDIAASPMPPGHRRLSWTWDFDVSAVTAPIWINLVYDETDDIAPERRGPKPVWFNDEEDVSRIWGHFYLKRSTIGPEMPDTPSPGTEQDDVTRADRPRSP